MKTNWYKKAALLLGAATWMAFAGFGNASGGTFSSNFDSGQPPGSALYGWAFVDGFGGVGDSGVLKLTEAISSEEGSFMLDDLDAGTAITGFTASFKMLIGGGSQADGLSFNFANDLPDSSFGEEGAGTGLSICFDTYDNGGGEAPAIDVKQAGAVIASAKNNLNLFRTGDFIDVLVQALPDGSLTLTVNGSEVFSGLPSAFVSSPGRFGFGARTGGFSDNHFIDNLEITTTSELPEHPFVISRSPQGTGAREDANIQVVLGDGVNAVNPASIQLKLNGATVTPSITKSGTRTTVIYDPPSLLASGADQEVSLSFSDNGNPATAQTSSWTFQVRYYLGPTGNIYEMVQAVGISWDDANFEAQQRTYHSRHGHLATISSYDEDVFVNKVRTTSFSGSASLEVWLGGWQTLGLGSTEGWHWIHNDGDFPGANGGAVYTNWRSGEPNDYYGPDSENFLSLGLFGEFAWNDEGYPPQMGGYIVEYEGTPVQIDIKPDGYPNVVNVQDQGKISVAVLSGAGFDATKVNIGSVRFGRTGKEAAVVNSSKKDVNGDGTLDLLLTFNLQDTDWACGDEVGILIGRDAEGLSFRGSDSVRLTGCAPYGLEMTALQDVRQDTQVRLEVSPLLKGYTAPAVAQKVQLKSYKISGQLGWTKNVSNVPLAPVSPNKSAGTLSFSDLSRHQTILGQANVPNSKSGKTEILRAEARVLYRPDFAIQTVVAPEIANTYHLVNINATINELNGDLGGTTDAYLLDGADVIDLIPGAALSPGGNATLVFTARFTTVGTHSLRIVLANANPGDYDESNNAYSFAIEAVQPPLAPVAYSASYYHNDYEYYEQWDDDYSTGVYHTHNNYETFGETLYLPVAVTFPIAEATFRLTVDGAEYGTWGAQDIPATYSYDDGCVMVASGSVYLGDNTFINIESDSYCWGYLQSYASVYRYASEYTYFSSVYYKWYGYGYTNGPFTSGGGPFLNALNTVATRFVVDAPEGKFGGNGGIDQLFSSSYLVTFDYAPPTGYDNGYYRSSYASGDQWGTTDVTTP